MARYRNTLTGVVVVVDGDDATAAQLGMQFEPEKSGESKPDPKPAPKRRAPVNRK